MAKTPKNNENLKRWHAPRFPLQPSAGLERSARSPHPHSGWGYGNSCADSRSLRLRVRTSQPTHEWRNDTQDWREGRPVPPPAGKGLVVPSSGQMLTSDLSRWRVSLDLGLLVLTQLIPNQDLKCSSFPSSSRPPATVKG